MYSERGRSPSSGRGDGVRHRATAAARLGVALAVAWVAGVEPGVAQNTGRLTGLVVGTTESEQIWSPSVETAPRSGFLAGAFVDVATPAGALRVRAEGAFVRRGGLVLSDYRGGALDGEVQSEYLGLLVQAKLAASVGPLHLFAAAGPGVGYLVRSREDALVAQVLVQEYNTVFNVGAGVGAGVRLGGTLVAEVEGRWVRGLSNAYSGSSMTVRNRSLEWLVRLSRVSG